MKRKLVIIVLGLLTGFRLTYASEPFFHHFTVDLGLPDMELYNLYQSKNKFLWVGSSKGLIKFDGNRFITYQSPAQVSGALAGMTEDIFHRIWCHDFSGRIFILQNDTLSLFKLWDPEQSRNFPRITIDKYGFLYILYEDGVSLFKPNHQRKEYELSKKISLKNTLSFGMTGSGLFLFSPKGLLYIDSALHVTSVTGKLTKNIRSDVSGRCIFLEKEGSYYFISDDYRLYKINLLDFTFEFWHQFETGPRLTNVTWTGNEFWLSTFGGVIHYHFHNNIFTKQGHYFRKYQIADVLHDHEGNYWVSSLNDGLYLIPSLDIRSINVQNSSLQGKRILRLSKDKEGVYLGLANGNLYKFTYGEPEKLNPVESKQSVTSIYFDSLHQALYYASDYVYRIYQNKKYPAPEKLLSNTGVKDMLITTNNVLVAGVGGGLFLYIPKGLTIDKAVPQWMLPYLTESDYRMHSEVYHKCYQLLNKRIVFVKGDQELRTLWVGTKDGVYKIDKSGIHQPLFEKQVIYGTDACIYQEEIWLATINKGVIRIRGDNIMGIGTKNGLTSNRVSKVLVSGNKAYILSDNALQCLDMDNGKWKTLNENDGILPKQINDFQLLGNRIWIATSEGMIDVPMEMPELSPNPPVLFLRGVLNGQRVLSPIADSLLSLPYGKYNLKVKLGAISFRNLGKFRIQYRIFGWNNEWYSPLEENNVAIELTTLPPGKYHFEARAINSDGMVSQNAVHLHIHIDSPYWLKLWFILLVTIGGIGVLLLVFRLRIQAIHRNNQLLMEKELLQKELKVSLLSSIKSQMNPHFLFNSLNTIQNFIYKDQRKEANYFLGKFSDLMRKVLRLSSLEKITLEEEIETLNLYLELEKMRFQDSLEVTMEIDEKLDTGTIHIPAMIIQPFVENALKHGLLPLKKNRKLCITFKAEEPDLLKVSIEDNGIGRKASEDNRKRKNINHNSYSSEANRKRLELLNENYQPGKISFEIIDKTDEFNKASGTVVNLFIPF